MAQQKPSWKTSPDPEWRTRRPMTDSEARQIRAKNLKEAKAGGFKGDLTIKPDPRSFTQFQDLQRTVDKYFRNPPPGKFATVEPMAPSASSGKFATVEPMAPPASSGKFATVERGMAPPASSGKFATVTRMAPAAAEGKFATAAAPSMAGRMLRGAGRMVGRAAGPVGVAMTAYDLAKAFPAPAPMSEGEREEAARSYRTGPQPKSENMRGLAKAKAEMSKSKKGK